MTRRFYAKPTTTAVAVTLVAGLSAGALTGCAAAAVGAERTDAAAVQEEQAAPALIDGLVSTAKFTKSEVTYATLAADGTPQAAYVVNGFTVEEAGTVVDYGAYSNVANMTNSSALAHVADATTFEAEAGTTYYQGTLEEVALPWNVTLAYTLNGEPVRGEELAGATGNISIRLNTAKNEAVEDSSFYDSFMLQITFTLSGDACRDISAEGATVANSGQDRTVAFTVLPGNDGSFVLDFYAEDFTMEGVQIAALPYSSVIEMPDTSGMADGMQSLSDAVSQLNSGTRQLADGIGQLDMGGSELLKASDLINKSLQGLAQVNFSDLDSLLDLGPEEIKAAIEELEERLLDLQAQLEVTSRYQDALTQLDAKTQDLADASSKVTNLQALVDANPDNTGAADELAKLLKAAKSTSDEYALQRSTTFKEVEGLLVLLQAEVDSVIDSIEPIKQALEDLYNSETAGKIEDSLEQLGGLQSALQTLASSYTTFHDDYLVKYVNGVQQLISGANQLADGMEQLNANTITLPDTVREQIAAMTEGFTFPEFEPHSFVSEKNENVELVQFVLTTEAITKPAEPEEEAEEESEQTILDRLFALFQ